MSAFLRMLWSGRRKPNEALQERVAQYTVYPRQRSVQATPVAPPLRKSGGWRNG